MPSLRPVILVLLLPLWLLSPGALALPASGGPAATPPDPVDSAPGAPDATNTPARPAAAPLPPGDAVVVQPPNTWMGATLTFLGSLAGGLLCAACPMVFLAFPCCPWAGYALPPTMACGTGCGAGLAAAGTEMGADEFDVGRVLAPLLVAFGIAGAASLLPWVGAMGMTMLAASSGSHSGGSSTSTNTLLMNAGLIGLLGVSALIMVSAAASGTWVAARGDPHLVVEAKVKKATKPGSPTDEPGAAPSSKPSTEEVPAAPTTAMAF